VTGARVDDTSKHSRPETEVRLATVRRSRLRWASAFGPHFCKVFPAAQGMSGGRHRCP